MARVKSSGRVARLLTELQPTDSPSTIYAALAEGIPTDVVLAFGPGVYRELRQELRSVEAVGRWAIDLAIRLRRPVLINIPVEPDGSTHTVVMAPPDWSKDRLRGYVAGRHSEIEEIFGRIERVA